MMNTSSLRLRFSATHLICLQKNNMWSLHLHKIWVVSRSCPLMSLTSRLMMIEYFVMIVVHKGTLYLLPDFISTQTEYSAQYWSFVKVICLMSYGNRAVSVSGITQIPLLASCFSLRQSTKLSSPALQLVELE